MTIIGIIGIVEIIEIKIVNALEITVQDMMIEVKIDITINGIRGSSVDLRMKIEGANKIEGKKEKINREEIIIKKNIDYYEIYIIIRYSTVIIILL